MNLSPIRNRCFICGREGRSGKSEFLCEKCLILALKHPLFKCSNCGSTGVVTETVEKILKEQSGIELTYPSVILTNYCANCIKGLDKIDLKIKIYHLDMKSFS
jgi:Fe2+ or Zn2+ uptake regulation protein